MDRTYLTMPALASILFSACIIADDSGETRGDDETGSPTTTPPTSTSTTGTSSDTESVFCLLHCFSAPAVQFPYTDEPLDEDGNPNGALLQCQSTAGTTINLTSTMLTINEPTCANQDVAQAVQDIAICDSGLVPQPPPPEWETWVSLYSHKQQRDCVTQLVAMGCDASPVGAQGAEQVCFYFLEYPLYYELLSETPAFEEEDEPEMVAGSECDYDMLMDCDSVDESSGGGGVLPFGDVDDLVSCNSGFTKCYYQQELEEGIMLNTSRLYEDGVRLTMLKDGESGYPGVKILLPNRTPDSASEDLFQAFGFRNGDIIRAANGVFITNRDRLLDAFGTLFVSGTTTATVIRNGQTLRIQGIERG